MRLDGDFSSREKQIESARLDLREVDGSLSHDNQTTLSSEDHVRRGGIQKELSEQRPRRVPDLAINQTDSELAVKEART